MEVVARAWRCRYHHDLLVSALYGDPEEWTYNNHLPHGGVEPSEPDTCWEYPDGGSFDVDVDFVFNDDDHPDSVWYYLNLHGQAHLCELEPDGSFVETLDFVFVESPGDTSNFNVQDVQIPSGAECATLGIRWTEDTLSVEYGNYDISLRVFTKVDAPTSLSGDFDGDSIRLSWTNNETVQTDIERKVVGGGSWALYDSVASGVAAYADAAWDTSSTYRYRIRHHSPEPQSLDTWRLSDRTDPVSVAIPSALVAGIAGPDEVPPNEECVWVGTTSGGESPFSYEWTGIAEHSGSTLTASFGKRESGWLYLDVEDDNGWTDRDSSFVAVLPGAPTCPLMPGG